MQPTQKGETGILKTGDAFVFRSSWALQVKVPFHLQKCLPLGQILLMLLNEIQKSSMTYSDVTPEPDTPGLVMLGALSVVG